MATRIGALPLALLLPALVFACGTGDKARGSAPSGAIGTAQLFIQEVPGDVRCIRITAAGSRTRTDSFDVSPMDSAVLTMEALPAGDVTFSGDAFPVACADITMSVRPNWLSDPVTVEIVPGDVTDVTLVMRPVGGARIGVDFVGGGTGGATGGTGGSATGGTGGSATGGTGTGGTGTGGTGGTSPLGTWDSSNWDEAVWQ